MFSFVLDKFHLSLINIYLCFHLSISCENLVARSNCFLTTFIIDLYNFRSSTEKLLLMLFLPSLPAAWPRAFLWWKTKESRLKWELSVAKERFYDDIYLNKFLPLSYFLGLFCSFCIFLTLKKWEKVERKISFFENPRS